MDSVVELQAPSRWEIAPWLALALVLGGGVAYCCLAIVFGIGVEPAPKWAPALVAIAIAALAPSAWLVGRWRMLKPSAQLVLGADALTIAYPELLRSPLAVPRAVKRVAAIDDDGPYRFRVHTESGPFWGGQRDGYLWSRGKSALPILAPEGTRPNLLLLFDEAIAGADIRWSRSGALYRGERVAGLLLAADDPARAQTALLPLGFTRPLTMPDVVLLEDNLKVPEGGRLSLGRRHLLRTGWGLVALGVLVPVLALLGAVIGAVLTYGARRRANAALALVGLGVFAVRLVLWLG